MKVSIVIICWNDREDILRCLESIYRETVTIAFEVIVTDNGSTDGALEAIRERFPQARIIENPANLGFGGGNNAGFREAQGEYVLILNPDTLIHDHAIETFLNYADMHPEAGAFGCRVLNKDGSYQHSAHPPHTLRGYLIAGLYLRALGHLSSLFESDIYVDWHGMTEREIGFQAGCCLLIRRDLLMKLGGFDVRLFHQCEDADLCERVWKSGYSVRFCPNAVITHIGGLNRGRYPTRVILETHRSRYRYFFKHHGMSAVRRLRWITLIGTGIRLVGYGLLSLGKRDQSLQNRLEMYRVLIAWHWKIDPERFILSGDEPDVGFTPLSAPPNMLARNHFEETIAG